MTPPSLMPSVKQLRHRIRKLEVELHDAQRTAQVAQDDAARARQSAEAAWTCAKALRSLPRRSSEA